MATYHVDYTAAQIEAAIGKAPIIQDGYWYVWNVAQMQYVTTGIQAQGDDGKTAYESAVDGGFQGTEAEFNELLAGLNAYTERAEEAARQAGIQASGAIDSAGEASAAATNAADSESAASGSAALSESWAVGGTGTRQGEDTDNARFWAEQAQAAAGGGVTSFAGRSGVVQPASGDYTAEMVGAIPAEELAALSASLDAKADVSALDGKQDDLGFIESADYPGHFYRMVGDEQEWLNPPLIADVEYRTVNRFSKWTPNYNVFANSMVPVYQKRIYGYFNVVGTSTSPAIITLYSFGGNNFKLVAISGDLFRAGYWSFQIGAENIKTQLRLTQAAFTGNICADVYIDTTAGTYGYELLLSYVKM